MSAKACNRCGNVIVFGRDQDTGRVIPLMVGARVYRMVKDDIVTLDPKAFVPHVCAAEQFVKQASMARDFNEPKEGSE